MNAEVVRPSSRVDASQDKIAHGGERRESKPDAHGGERRESKPHAHGGERRESKPDAHDGEHRESTPDRSARDRRDSRWDEHRRARREQIVEATLAAVAKHGAGVGMDEIAAEAGTSKTVVYRHFTDRAELYVAVCNRVAAHLLPTLQSAIETSGSRPREMVAAAIDTYLAFIEADPELYRFVVHQQTLDRPTSDPIDGLSDVVGQQAAAAITVALQQSGHDAAAASPWGHGVVGLVRSAADWWLRSERPMLRTELAAHLTDLAWAGLSGVVTPEPNSSPTTGISTISLEAQ